MIKDNSISLDDNILKNKLNTIVVIFFFNIYSLNRLGFTLIFIDEFAWWVFTTSDAYKNVKTISKEV